MKATATAIADQEPVGIVISRGSAHDYVPKVLAYVWAPAPEIVDDAHDANSI
jgi:hypothetical protein